MTIIFALALGLLVGASLGALGGGGSVLTVPAPGLPTRPDPASSDHWLAHRRRAHRGRRHAAARTRRPYRLDAWPPLRGARHRRLRRRQHLASALDPDLLLLLFSLLTLTVAVLLLRPSERTAPRPVRCRHPAEASPQAQSPGRVRGAATAVRTSDGALPTAPDAGPLAPTRVTIDLACLTRLALAATGVGLFTGFFDVGGGFLVVPALVLGMPMRAAVDTSLVVIALNSATALAARSGAVTIDWGVILPFTAAAVLAAIGGGRLSSRATPEALRRAFAVLLIAVSIAHGHTQHAHARLTAIHGHLN